jgi:preprotein translocase subunit SecE
LVEWRSPKPLVGGSRPSWPATQVKRNTIIPYFLSRYNMNTQAEAQTPVFDIIKQVFSGLLVIAAVAAFYFFSEISILYRVIALLVVMVIVFGLMFTTNLGRGLWSFFLESKQEVRKVVWPNRDETTRTTMLVIAMVFTVGFILWLLDMFLFWGVRLLTGQGV